jgi:hypothetical protein
MHVASFRKQLFAHARSLGCLPTFLVGFGGVSRAFAVTQRGSPANATVAENCLPGNPSSERDVGPSNSGDLTIQGFATDISVNHIAARGRLIFSIWVNLWPNTVSAVIRQTPLPYCPTKGGLYDPSLQASWTAPHAPDSHPPFA